MTTTKLALGVCIGIVAAVLIVFVVVQLGEPQDCGLQQLEVSNGNRLWVKVRFDNPTGVSIDGSAELPGLHDCYYSDDDGTTITQATAGTPFPLAHAAQVK